MIGKYNLWMKVVDKLTVEIGTMSLEMLGFATAIPATALVTETAGVSMPSASVRLVLKRAYSTKRIGKKDF